jgi:hypothetical protein
MRANDNKPLEYGEANAAATPAGSTVTPPSRLPGASTLSELNASGKTGTVAPEGVNATIGTLDRVRVDSSGQVLTTNQGVPLRTTRTRSRRGRAGPRCSKTSSCARRSRTSTTSAFRSASCMREARVPTGSSKPTNR